jgi:hypothetical protein
LLPQLSVNQAPTLTLPFNATCYEHDTLTFSSHANNDGAAATAADANVNGVNASDGDFDETLQLFVADVDADESFGAFIDLFFTVDNGTISLQPSPGVYVVESTLSATAAAAAIASGGGGGVSSSSGGGTGVGSRASAAGSLPFVNITYAHVRASLAQLRVALHGAQYRHAPLFKGVDKGAFVVRLFKFALRISALLCFSHFFRVTPFLCTATRCCLKASTTVRMLLCFNLLFAHREALPMFSSRFPRIVSVLSFRHECAVLTLL